jgi:hypothetical protein
MVVVDMTPSRAIAADFLQTVVLVDDQAELRRVTDVPDETSSPGPIAGIDPLFEVDSEEESEPEAGLQVPENQGAPESGEDTLDAKTVIDRFSELGLVCGVIRPDPTDPLSETVGPVATRADILVLDWWLNGDAGEASLALIRHVVSDIDHRHRVRLIVVYTAERDLRGIAQRIAGILDDATIVGDNRVIAGPVHVTVFAKPETNVGPELADAVVNFYDLPDRVINEFVDAVQGLLPNVVLSSLAAIRSNTHRILNRFSKELDPAYLGHRILLPHPDDAQDHITNLVAQELSSVLNNARVGDVADTTSVASLVSASLLQARSIAPVKAAAEKKNMSDGDYALDLVRYGIDWKESQLSVKHKKDAHDWTTKLYSSDDESAKEIELRFAALMKNRSRYENPPPRLGLGVFLRDIRSSKFYLCMQPVCDSTRLSSTTAFPFLPLNEGEGAIDFVLGSDGDLRTFKISLKLRDVRMLNFRPGPTPPGVVMGERDGDAGEWKFQTARTNGASFVWVGELREGWAHHYANRFADESSRVGVDDSEWARRSK